MNRLWTREEFCDGDDVKKWSEEAARQLEVHPPGAEQMSPSVAHPFIRWQKEFNVPSDGTVVDFGCGTGLIRPVFAEMNYIGVDQNPDMLIGIQKRWQGRDSKVRAFESPLNQITLHHPELKEVADVGCFCTVLQHNHWETAKEILAQAFQVLKPGAILMMFEATFTDEKYPLETRIKYKMPAPDPERLLPVDGGAVFTPKGWANMLDEAGFDHLEYDGDCGHVSRRRA